MREQGTTELMELGAPERRRELTELQGLTYAALARLSDAGVPVARTDLCGEVPVVTDGERLWVRTAR